MERVLSDGRRARLVRDARDRPLLAPSNGTGRALPSPRADDRVVIASARSNDVTTRTLLKPALGALAFFVVAPGGVVGLAPWLITGGWRHDDVPAALRAAGSLLILA